MPVIGTRKIIQVGGSRSVSLPPGWLEACGLDLGDKVELVADGVILIAPLGQRLRVSQLTALIEVLNRRAGGISEATGEIFRRKANATTDRDRTLGELRQL